MNDAVKKIRTFGDFIQNKEFNLSIGINDTIYAVMCYVMSACQIFDGRTPFALCAYAAAFSKGKWSVFLVLSALGFVRYRMDFTSVIYIASMAVSTVFMGIVHDKRFYRALSLGLAFFTLSLCVNIAHGFLWEKFVLDFLEALICFFGTFCLQRAVGVVTDFKEKRNAGETDVFYLYITLAVIIRCFLHFPLLQGLNVSVILSLLCLMIISLGGDFAYSTGAGVIFGMAVYDGTSSFAASAGAFAMASLLAGTLKNFGKWGVVTAFITVNTVFVAFFSSEVLPYDIFEIIASAVFFALVPQTFISYVLSKSDVSHKTASNVYLSRDKVQSVISGRLDRLSDAYSSLALSYEKCFESKNMSKNYIIHMLDSASAKICPGCGLKYNCWERNYRESYKSMLTMLEIAEENGVILPDDVPMSMRQKCIKLDEFISAFNRMYEVYKVEKLWQQRLNDSRMLVSSQLEGISRSVRKLATEFDMSLDTIAEKELKSCLSAERIKFTDLTFLKGDDETFRIEISSEEKTLSEKAESVIIAAIKEVTGKNASKVSVRYTATGMTAVFKPTSKYTITAAFSLLPRNGENVSGDSYALCENYCGEFVAALSDGMGTGALASAESTNAIELLKNFMMAGMEVETALELINSALLLRSSGDSFATMDVCVVNTDEGVVSFYKNGAAPGYIKNASTVSKIYSDSLPFGVLSDYGKISTEIYVIEESAMVVMVSDGLCDVFSNGGEDKLKTIIEHTQTDNPRLIASHVTKEALKVCGGKPEDDMTVLVLSIKKSK